MPKRKLDATEAEPEAPRRSARLSANQTPSNSTTKATKAPAKKIKKVIEKVKKTMSGQDDGLEGVTVVEVGEKIPSLTLKTDTGDEISTTALAGDKKGFVIFTYPKANTSGCTNQACGFRDKHDLFLEKGYAVYGLSKDSPASQSSWKEAQSLPYTLLCDPNSELIKPLGCFKAGGGTARCHFVFDKDGTLKEKKLNVKPVESPVDALESVGKL